MISSLIQSLVAAGATELPCLINNSYIKSGMNQVYLLYFLTRMFCYIFLKCMYHISDISDWISAECDEIMNLITVFGILEIMGENK